MTSKVMGRKRIEFDWDMVEKILMSGCTGAQAAAAVGISFDTLNRRCVDQKHTTFADFAAKKRQKGNSMLHAKQFQTAMEGNTTMLIWLGKQRLGQEDQPRDKQEFNGSLAGLLGVMHMVKTSEDFDAVVQLSKEKKLEEIENDGGDC